MIDTCRFGMLVKYISVPPIVSESTIGIVVSFGPENDVKVRWYDGFQCVGEWWCSRFDLKEVVNV